LSGKTFIAAFSYRRLRTGIESNGSLAAHLETATFCLKEIKTLKGGSPLA